MSRFWLAAALLSIAACSPPPERASQAEVTEALFRERPDDQLQQVHPVTVDGKPAFCGTAGRIVERKSGQAEIPIELFLFKEGRFHWARGPAADGGLVEEHCRDIIYTHVPELR